MDYNEELELAARRRFKVSESELSSRFYRCLTKRMQLDFLEFSPEQILSIVCEDIISDYLGCCSYPQFVRLKMLIVDKFKSEFYQYISKYGSKNLKRYVTYEGISGYLNSVKVSELYNICGSTTSDSSTIISHPLSKS